MSLVKLVVLSLVLAATQVNASTVTLDMEGIAPAGDISNETNTTTTFSGFDLLINHGHFIDSTWSEVGVNRADSGSDYLGIDSYEPIVISQTSGAPFSIQSFDATDVFIDQFYIPNLVFEVTGTQVGGGTLTTSFTSDNSYGFETFVFGSAWTNLTSVMFIGNNHGAYDNIVLSSNVTVVPLPAAVWLFGSGIMMLLGFGRNRAVRSVS